MTDIIELAERLGKAIADSPQARNMRQARDGLQKDQAAIKLLQDYQAQTEKVEKLTEENKPVEVDDKHRLQELQDKLAGTDVFKRYTAAQVEYIDLMRKVNDALQGPLDETEGAAEPGE